MLNKFLQEHRGELIERCRGKVALRTSPPPMAEELEEGIPLFLDQLIRILGTAKRGERPAEPGPLVSPVDLEGEAMVHGRRLFERGYSIEQVVRDYGDLCQAITEMASELNAPFEVEEFKTLNRSLDDAIAGAVTAFNYRRDSVVADRDAKALNVRLGFFAHELRNLLNTATLALLALKEGDVGIRGATGTILDRSLIGLRILVDRSLTEVRLAADLPAQLRLFSLADFVAEVKLSASLEAKACECVLHISVVDPLLAVDADRDLLLSAVGNLLQNAFKFTHHGSEVRLRAYAEEDRIRIDVQDHCGGLPPGDAERLFHPFQQAEANRTGLGLGLAISKSSVEANRGTLSVHDLPGAGCIFSIDLPRHQLPERALAEAG